VSTITEARPSDGSSSSSSLGLVSTYKVVGAEGAPARIFAIVHD